MKQRSYFSKTLITVCSLIFTANFSFAQENNTLTLDSCFTMAKKNYPLVKQMALVDQAKEYSIENANKNYLPTIVVNGQASYQSQVTELPIKIPNLTLPSLNKDQYRIYGEINQPITDLFNVKNQKELINTSAEIESQRTEVELYKLNERITNLYFGILLIDAQLRQTEILKGDIQAGLDKTKAAIDNGAALKSNANILRAEMLKADQRSVELEANRKAYCEMLGLFINQPVDELTKLQTPATVTQKTEVKRPELKLYELQKQTFETQKKLLNARYLPKAGLFLQGGYGRPALNMLSNAFESYYIGGLRLNWNITGYYTLKKEKKILDINRSSTDLQSETFLFNTKLSMSQQNREIRKYEELIISDNEIVGLRESIKNTSKEQLQYGAITANDYITYVNAEDQARQNLAMHQIQLLLAQYTYQNTTGF